MSPLYNMIELVKTASPREGFYLDAAVRTGLEPVISTVTVSRDNHYTNEPNGDLGGIRTRECQNENLMCLATSPRDQNINSICVKPLHQRRIKETRGMKSFKNIIFNILNSSTNFFFIITT